MDKVADLRSLGGVWMSVKVVVRLGLVLGIGKVLFGGNDGGLLGGLLFFGGWLVLLGHVMHLINPRL